MTRFRIRLLITLALFATAMVAVAPTVHASQTWSVDGTSTTTQTTIGALKGPGAGTTSGEPDLTGNNKIATTKSATPQQTGGEGVPVMWLWSVLGRWIWAAWFPILWR